MTFNKSSLTFTSTNSPTSPNLPKKGSKIGQWRPRLKCFSKERHFFYNFVREAMSGYSEFITIKRALIFKI